MLHLPSKKPVYLPERLYRLRLRRLALFISEHVYRGTDESDKFLEHYPMCPNPYCGQRRLPTLFNWFLHWDCHQEARAVANPKDCQQCINHMHQQAEAITRAAAA